MLPEWEHPNRLEAVRVLRITLRGPLTLGHVLLLDELGSPIVSGAEFGIGDLGLAVMVCKCQTAEEARRDARSWWAKPLLRFWASTCGKLDFEQESTRFVKWFSSQCGGPEPITTIKEGQSPPRALAAPWYINKLSMAVGELGISIAEAEALPVKRLNQLTGGVIESRGNLQFQNEDEADAFAIVKHWMADAAAKGGGDGTP